MIDGKKALQSICQKWRTSFFNNSGSISMTYQRIQATVCLLIPLHSRGGGEACAVVSVCELNQSYLNNKTNPNLLKRILPRPTFVCRMCYKN